MHPESRSPTNAAGGDGFSNNRFASRGDWIRALEALTSPAASQLQPDFADLPLPGGGASYGEVGRRLERVVRVLLGSALLANATGEESSLAPFAKALAVGTDPESPAFFGIPGDLDQRVVEMAGVSLALAICPAALWEARPVEVRERLAAWLASGNQVQLPPNNWALFRIFTNAVLHRLGMPAADDPSAADWAAVDECYVGEGWYNDGQTGRTESFDYYNPCGFHYYSLLTMLLHPEMEAGRAEKIRDRALAIAPAVAALQADTGLHLPFGRSLTYRFVPAGFAGVCAVAGLDDAGTRRQEIARCLRFWGKQDFRDGGGLLTIGFTYPNTHFSENYNAPGSPYFALNAFLPLWLPEDHPFWNTPAPPPVERPLRISLTIPRLTVVEDHDHHRGIFAGQRQSWALRHEGEKYAKFAYSSRHGFQVSGGWHGLHRLGFDSSAAISEDGALWRLRERPEDCRLLSDGSAFSRWTVPGWIDAESTVDEVGGLQIRHHVLRVHRPLDWLEGGWPFPIRSPDPVADGRMEEEGDSTVFLYRSGSPWFSALAPLAGHSGTCGIVGCDPNLNVLHPLTVLPYFREHLEPGTHERSMLVGGFGWDPVSWRESLRQKKATKASDHPEIHK